MREGARERESEGMREESLVEREVEANWSWLHSVPHSALLVNSASQPPQCPTDDTANTVVTNYCRFGKLFDASQPPQRPH